MRHKGLALVLMFFLVLGLALPTELDAVSPSLYYRTVNAVGLHAANSAAFQSILSNTVALSAGARTTSLGLRLLTAGTGWVGLGVSVGLVALEYYYAADEINELYDNTKTLDECYKADVSGTIYELNLCGTFSGSSVLGIEEGVQTGIEPCGSNNSVNPGSRDFVVKLSVHGSVPGCGTSGFNINTCRSSLNLPHGGSTGYFTWDGGTSGSQRFICSAHLTTTPATFPYQDEEAPTPQQVSDWLDANPTHPLSLDSQRTNIGTEGTPQAADEVVTEPLTSQQTATEIKPGSEVEPEDVVFSDPLNNPPGTEPQSPVVPTTTTTTTTTTTLDEEGNPVDTTTTTTTTEETISASCPPGSMETRTVGSIFQSHIDTWGSSGLLGTLATFYAVTFTDELPVIAINTQQHGNFSLDFNDFAWVFLALKIMLISYTALFAYRLVLG